MTGRAPGNDAEHLNLQQLLSRVEYEATARLSHQLRTTGGGVEEWRVLGLLSDSSGHPMSEVAEAAMLPAPTVTRLIDRLVAANLVYRRPDDEDRRRLLVFMTERGAKLYEDLDAIVSDHEEVVTSILGTDSKVLAELLLDVLAGFGRVE